jgi:putative sigma-54 modulation protein
MELKIVGKNIEITESLREYLDKKMAKLTRHLSNLDEAKVEIHEVKAKSPDQQVIVQVTIKSKGALLRAEEKAANTNIAVDAVTKVLERQIERYRGKFDKKGRDSVRELQLKVPPEAVNTDKKSGFFPEIVRVKRFPIKAMSVSEASEQMELLSHDFFLFINSDTGELNLVYRRKDGNYGILEPLLA